MTITMFVVTVDIIAKRRKPDKDLFCYNTGNGTNEHIRIGRHVRNGRRRPGRGGAHALSDGRFADGRNKRSDAR